MFEEVKTRSVIIAIFSAIKSILLVWILKIGYVQEAMNKPVIEASESQKMPIYFI